MKRFHISIATHNIAASVADYSARLGQQPDSMLDNEYALWRTDSLNFSVRFDKTVAAGTLRHFGWEDSDTSAFTSDKDVNNILWENFSAEHQADEISALWPK